MDTSISSDSIAWPRRHINQKRDWLSSVSLILAIFTEPFLAVGVQTRGALCDVSHSSASLRVAEGEGRSSERCLLLVWITGAKSSDLQGSRGGWSVTISREGRLVNAIQHASTRTQQRMPGQVLWVKLASQKLAITLMGFSFTCTIYPRWWPTFSSCGALIVPDMLASLSVA